MKNMNLGKASRRVAFMSFMFLLSQIDNRDSR